MNVVIPVLGFGKSGGQRVLSRLGTSLVENGATVIFVAPVNCEPIYYETKAKIIYASYKANGNKFIDLIQKIFGVIRTINSISPDIVIANYFITSYFLIFTSRNAKKVYYIQADESKLHKRWYLNFMATISYRFPWHKVVNSDKILPLSVANIEKIIPAGLDINNFFSVKPPINKERFSLGIIGRKETYKGTRELLSVLAEPAFKNLFVLKVAIHFPEEFREHFDTLEITPINNDTELAEFYRNCDLIIATGLIEDGAFHYPCAEAMATGRVVISNYAPLSETSSELTIQKFSPELIREKLHKFLLMTEDEIRQEVESNQKHVSSYSWDRIGKEMYNYLSSIVH